jgi:hypothetical protein
MNCIIHNVVVTRIQNFHHQPEQLPVLKQAMRQNMPLMERPQSGVFSANKFTFAVDRHVVNLTKTMQTTTRQQTHNFEHCKFATQNNKMMDNKVTKTQCLREQDK